MIIQENKVDPSACFPRRSVELDPAPGLVDDMPSRDSREEFLRTFNPFPERLKVRVPESFQVGHGASTTCLVPRAQSVTLEAASGRSCLAQSGSEVGQQGSESAHLSFQFLCFFTDFDELRAVLVHIVRQVCRGAILNLAKLILIFEDILLIGIRKDLCNIYDKCQIGRPSEFMRLQNPHCSGLKFGSCSALTSTLILCPSPDGPGLFAGAGACLYWLGTEGMDGRGGAPERKSAGSCVTFMEYLRLTSSTVLSA